jgi:hypothetical protein
VANLWLSRTLTLGNQKGNEKMSDMIGTSHEDTLPEVPKFEFNLDMALHLVRAGIRILPCEPLGSEFEKSPLIVGYDADGEPIHWAFSKHMITSELEVIEVWTEHPTALIGVPGGVNGFVIADLDEKGDKHGITQFEKLQEEHGKIPPTPSQKTPNGGMHVFMGATEESVKMMSNSKDPADGIDVRTENYYVCTGIEYPWLSDLAGPKTPCASWFVNWTHERQAKQKENGKVSPKVEGEIFHKGKLPEPEYPKTTRNDNLISVAGAYRAQGFDYDQIFALLKVANQKYCRPPLSETEVSNIAKSASKYATEGKIAAEEIEEEEEGLRFPIVRGGESLKDQPPIDYIVRPMFGVGDVGMLYGAFGHKKTWSGISMGANISMGVDWVGFPTKQARVLLVDEESGKRRMLRRLGQVNRGIDNLANPLIDFISTRQVNLKSKSDMKELIKMIKGEDYGFVEWDALRDLISIFGGDENTAKDTQYAFMQLRAVAEETDAAQMVLHHPNKKGEYSGSTAIPGALDFMIKVTSPEKDPIVRFKMMKMRDGELFSFNAKASWADNMFTLTEHNGPAPDADKPAEALTVIDLALADVLDFIVNEEVVTAKEVAKKFGWGMSKSRTMLHKLILEMKIWQTNKGATGAGNEAKYAPTA